MDASGFQGTSRGACGSAKGLLVWCSEVWCGAVRVVVKSGVLVAGHCGECWVLVAVVANGAATTIVMLTSRPWTMVMPCSLTLSRPWYNMVTEPWNDIWMMTVIIVFLSVGTLWCCSTSRSGVAAHHAPYSCALVMPCANHVMFVVLVIPYAKQAANSN